MFHSGFAFWFSFSTTQSRFCREQNICQNINKFWVPQKCLILNNLSGKSCREWRPNLKCEQNCSLQHHTTNTEEPEMSLPRVLAVLKEEGLLCSIRMLSSRTVRQLRFVEEGLHLPRAAPSLVTFPLPLETVPRDAGQLHFSKAFPHYFRAHSSKCDPIPLKLRIPDDFVAPGPRKTGFFPYQKTKQHFFFLIQKF